MIWFVLFVCFCIGWAQQASQRSQSWQDGYYKPPAAPRRPHHAPTKPRKIILPDSYTA
jgi:hypothetical protein